MPLILWLRSLQLQEKIFIKFKFYCFIQHRINGIEIEGIKANATVMLSLLVNQHYLVCCMVAVVNDIKNKLCIC